MKKNPITGAYGRGPRVARRTGELESARTKARTAGETYYGVGVPCRFGHLAGRYVSTKQCVECHYKSYLNERRITPHRHRGRRDIEAMRVAGRKAYEASAKEREAKAIELTELDRIRAVMHVHNRRAKKQKNGGKYTPADVTELYRLQRGRCAVCTVALRGKFHQDHVVPLSAGGSNDKNNLQLLCPTCNHSKHARHPIEFMQSRGFLL